MQDKTKKAQLTGNVNFGTLFLFKTFKYDPAPFKITLSLK